MTQIKYELPQTGDLVTRSDVTGGGHDGLFLVVDGYDKDNPITDEKGRLCVDIGHTRDIHY